jgi:hypothetical protein
MIESSFWSLNALGVQPVAKLEDGAGEALGDHKSSVTRLSGATHTSI